MTTLTASDRDALMRHIADHPRDDDARLVLADWFRENGQPGFGDYICRKVAAAKLPEPKRKGRRVVLQDTGPTEEETLVKTAGFGPPKGVSFCGWSRGLPDEALIRAGYRDDDQSARAVLSMPIRKLRLEGDGVRCTRLAANPDLWRVREIISEPVEEKGLDDLISSEHLRPLDRVCFAGTDRGALDRLVGLPPGRQPKRLWYGAGMRPLLRCLPVEEVWSVLGRMPAGRTTELNLQERVSSDLRFSRLADWPVLSGLRDLSFGRCLSDEKVRVLASTPRLAGLKRLGMTWCTRAEIRTLAASPYLRGVKIRVSRDELSREEAARIRDAGGPRFMPG